MSEQRRKLTFDDLDQVIEDAHKLLADAYVPTGKWDLVQVYVHLHDWMRFPLNE